MKILIIRLSSLGDCVLLVPLARYLKTLGAVEVTVVTKNVYVELFSAAEGVDRVVGFDPKTGLRGLLRIAARNRREGYIVFDAHNNLRSRLLSAWLGGASARFRKHYRERLGLILFKKRCDLPSILELYGELAAAAGFRPGKLVPGGLLVPARYEEQAKTFFSERSGKSLIAVAPGAKWPMKRWAADKYLELSRRLAEVHGCNLLLVGDENDRAVSSRIKEDLGESCFDVSGRTGILECAGYLKLCDAFVGNDSGLTHLAEAVGVPVVAVFGPTVKAFGYYPALPRSVVIEKDIDCRPCSRNGSRPCPIGTHECLEGIDVDTVEAAVTTLLSKKPLS